MCLPRFWAPQSVLLTSETVVKQDCAPVAWMSLLCVPTPPQTIDCVGKECACIIAASKYFCQHEIGLGAVISPAGP